MKIGVEEDDKMSDQLSLIASLEKISNISNDKDFLGELRDILSDPGFSLTQLVNDIDDHLIGALYCLLVLVNDVWANLAIDASFAFPMNHPRLIGLVRELRYFIIASLKVNKDNKEAAAEAFVSFGRAIKEYCFLLQDLEHQLEQGNIKNGGGK